MKRILFLIFPILFFSACEQYPTPGTHILEKFNFQVVGADQSTEAGNYLPDSVGIIIDFESLVPAGERQFTMETEVAEGGGTVDQTVVYSDKNGNMKTRWKVGDHSNEQILKVKIYDTEGLFSSETEIKATSFFSDKLNTITRGFLVGIGDMVRDTVNDRSMLISGRNLYVMEDKFYNWQPRFFPFNTNLKELETNSKGEVFAAGWNGELYQTSDWGENWINLGKPISENPYHYELSVTKDDNIWVSRWYLKMHCSTDGGLSWQKDTTNIASDSPLGSVYLFGDTSHLALASNVMQTVDDGITWKSLDNPQYPSTLFVTDKNEIILQGQEGGFTLYKSIDSGKTYKRVLSPSVAYGTTSWNCYDKFKNFYYVLAPGGGVWKTKDFEEFEELMRFSLQRNLFIDHKGNIYASGFSYSNAADDPTLILPAND